MVQLFQAMVLGRRISKAGRQKVDVVSLVQKHEDLVFMKGLF